MRTRASPATGRVPGGRFDNRSGARTIRGMAENQLRHLAVVAEGAFAAPGPAARGPGDAIARAAARATEAFALVPGLEAYSFVAPEIDRLLGDPGLLPAVAADCLRGGRELAAAAQALGATLRLCGRLEGLPGELRALGGGADGAQGRTVLWFLRYSGREEIARAATRFARAHPGKLLADSDLDAWLDTAGVPDPDLIVLAGGELEPRDALLWQGSYAEYWHAATPWSRFDVEDLRRAVAGYRERQRRFGR